MATKGEQKNQTGVVGNVKTMSTLWARGPEGARTRLLPSPRASPATRPSPPPRQDPGVGRVPGGQHFLQPGLGREQGLAHIPAGPPGGDPGAAAHPHAHPPAAPPALHRGRPKSHREPRERPWGAGREREADSGAQNGRRALHKDLGPPDASTQTQ